MKEESRAEQRKEGEEVGERGCLLEGESVRR